MQHLLLDHCSHQTHSLRPALPQQFGLHSELLVPGRQRSSCSFCFTTPHYAHCCCLRLDPSPAQAVGSHHSISILPPQAYTQTPDTQATQLSWSRCSQCCSIMLGPVCAASLQAVYIGHPVEGFRYYAVVVSVATARASAAQGLSLTVANSVFTDTAKADGASALHAPSTCRPHMLRLEPQL